MTDSRVMPDPFLNTPRGLPPVAFPYFFGAGSDAPDRDENLLLEVAARIAFPDGKVTARVLREEAKRRRLNISRVGKHLYTTLAEIEKMVEACRVQAKARVSSPSTQKSGTHTGSSGTAHSNAARARALKIATSLSKSSKST